MVALFEELGGLRRLDDLAEVHHGDAVADVFDDLEIVRDEEKRETEFVLQLLQEVHDLCLNRDVEGADGLVAHDELGPNGESAGDADALALPAGELVRIAAHGVLP